MPKKKSLSDAIKEDISIALNNRDEARSKFSYWSQRLTDAEQELARLEAARDALEGRTSPARTEPEAPYCGKTLIFKNHTLNMGEKEEMLPESRPVVVPNRPEKVMFNGDEIELEPGFRVGKNSFGEDVLLPIGMPQPVPMQEPLSVRKPEFSLPAATGFSDFISPEDEF